MMLEEQGKETCRVSASPLLLITHAHVFSVPFSCSDPLSEALSPPNEKPEHISSLQLSSGVKMLLSPLPHYTCLSL